MTQHAIRPIKTPPTMSTNLAIIIVSWNVRQLLANCLRTVYADLARSQLTGRVWVVDNASSDGSAEMVANQFPQTELIVSPENIGFAAGNNLALRGMGFGEANASLSNASLPETVMLLNPDTEVQPGALSAMLDFVRQTPQVGLVGAQLAYGDGSFQHAAFDFPGLWQLAIELLPLPNRLVESRLNGRYPRVAYQRGQPFRIGHPLGAAMLVRREAVQQVGLLDEGYHMYVEEVDWSKRITQAGWQAYCVPTARITHFGGQSSDQIKIDSFINLWRSRYRFYTTYYHPLNVSLARTIVQLGMRRKQAHDLAALKQDRLAQTEYDQLSQAYQRVINIWRGNQA